MNKVVFYVPENYKESVKQAVFEQGAGRYENYDCCSWETLGTGQFKPLVGSSPFVGEQNKIETVTEYRVEMICADKYLKNVIQALLTSHPYETPAYDIQSIQLLNDL